MTDTHDSTSGSTLVDCPAPGCDYSGSKTSVKGHWGGKQDDTHQGPFHEAYEAHNEAREEAQADARPRSDGGDDDSGVTFPEADDADSGGTQSTDDTVELPCGHESFNPDDAPPFPFRVECDECGGTWVVDE